jgi:hypothetical protein
VFFIDRAVLSKKPADDEVFDTQGFFGSSDDPTLLSDPRHFSRMKKTSGGRYLFYPC